MAGGSKKLPAFQFYPGDWRKDPGVQALDFHDRGVWFEMLCLMHESEERGVLLLNGQPMDESALSRLLGLDKQILTKALTTLLTYGVASRREEDGALICRRMVRDEHIRQIRQSAGKKGGNPRLLKQNRTTGDKQIPTPSSSSSISSSSSDVKDPPTPLGQGCDTRKAWCERIYQAYPKHVGKADALKAIDTALKRPPNHEFHVTPESLLAAVMAFAEAVRGADPQYIPGPATWIRKTRWIDDRDDWKRIGRSDKRNQEPGIEARAQQFSAW